jgi:hypothetical protein
MEFADYIGLKLFEARIVQNGGAIRLKDATIFIKFPAYNQNKVESITDTHVSDPNLSSFGDGYNAIEQILICHDGHKLTHDFIDVLRHSIPRLLALVLSSISNSLVNSG